MKTYTWSGGEVRPGIRLVPDEHLGQVVFLGEEGRGRRYEKIAFGKRNPAEVVNGRVLEAHPMKITLPAKDQKPEKSFWVLEKSEAADGDAVLVRIYTLTSYMRGASGRYEVVSGQPETLIAGHGAFGDAGRIGTWADGLVVIKPGDVLRIFPSRGDHSYALWLDDNVVLVTATWQEYENLQAVAKAETTQQTLKIAFGKMPAFTYTGSGVVQPGLKVSKGTTGLVVALGEEGRGRKLVEIPILGEPPMKACPERGKDSKWYSIVPPHESEKKCEQCGIIREMSGQGYEARFIHPDEGQVYVLDPLTETALTDLGQDIFGLVQSEKSEPNAYLVRVAPVRQVHRQYMRCGMFRGNPIRVAAGMFAGGDAGYAGSVDDTLWVLKPGDAVVIESTENLRVIENKNGKIIAPTWKEWEIADGKVNSEAYVAKGKAPWGHVPAEWLGRVVHVIDAVKEYGSRSGAYYDTRLLDYEGELISIDPFVVNLGWDGSDFHGVTIPSGVWVKLNPDKRARQPEGSELSKRKEAKTEAEKIKAEAKALHEQKFFQCFAEGLRERIAKVADGKEDREGSYLLDLSLATTEEIQRWNGWAKGVMSEANEASASAKEIYAQRERGEVLVEFGGHFRRMGASGNCDYWVVKPDGSLHNPDEVEYRKRYTSEGEKHWAVVRAEELALEWFGGNSCHVAKLPVSDLTVEQAETVRRIETENIGVLEGAFGLNAEKNKYFSSVVTAIRGAVRCPACNSELPADLRYVDLATIGIPLQCCGGRKGGEERIQQLLNRKHPEFNRQHAGREAAVVLARPLSDGRIVEVLAYQKFGGWNLDILLRKATKE